MADQSTQPVRFEVRGPGVAVITIDRPDARNAVDPTVAKGVAAAADRLDADRELSVGVLTGAGGTFCAGLDLKAFLRGESPNLPGRGFAGLTERPPRKPLIAAVEGYALAGGFEVALGCDLIVAAENAKFGLPEVKRSLVAAAGGLIRLPRRIPYHLAMELALTGEPVTAARAYEMGLVNRVVATGGALDAAVEFASAIGGNGPLALTASKEIVAGALDRTEAAAFTWQREISGPVFDSADAREGAQAFAEKRAPVWRGE